MTYIKSRWEAINSTPARTGANFTGSTDLYFKYNLALNERIIGDKCFLVITDAINANGVAPYDNVANISTAVDAYNRSANAGTVWNIARALNHVPAYFSQIDMLYSSKVLTSQTNPQLVDTVKKRLRYNEDYLNNTFSSGNWKSFSERLADCAGSPAGAKGAIKTWTWNLNDCLGPMDDVLNPGLYEFKFKIDSDFQNKVLESGGKLGGADGDIVTLPPAGVSISVEDVQLYLYIVETVEQPERKFKISFTENQFSTETSGLAGTKGQITTQIKPKTKRLTIGFQNTNQNVSRFFRSTELDSRNAVLETRDPPDAGFFDYASKLKKFRVEHAGQKYPNNDWEQEESATAQKGSRVMYYMQQLAANKDLNPGGASESYDKWKASRIFTFETVKREDNLDSQLKINDIEFTSAVTAGDLRCCILAEYKKTFEVELNESFGVTNVAEV